MNAEELNPDLIHYGYELGAFPMTLEDGSIGWFQPRIRALFPIEGIHVSRSLARAVRKGGFQITFDTAFEHVMRSCMRPDDNWISEKLIEVYTKIHFEGWGHSCEVWAEDDLIGGIYGIAMGSCFCAESMFHRKTNASKIALWAMVEKCRDLGFTIFDAQIMNPHLESLGAFEITHYQYMQMLHEALRKTNVWSRRVLLK